MAFQPKDIGTNYDVGLATRPNLDGSTATLNCLNENGSQAALSQVAFMFLAEDEVEEAVDLIRKDQMIRLSTANVIDREFTLYPQATQGNWVGGEGQRIFTDPTSYYQGRGLIWPTSSFVPVLPVLGTDVGALVDNLGNIFTQTLSMQAFLASGYVNNAGSGVVHGFRGVSSAGTFYYVVFTKTNASSQQSGNIISAPTPGGALPVTATIVNGSVYFCVASDPNLYQLTYSAGQAFDPVVTFAVLPNPGRLLVSGYVGKDWILAAAALVGQSVRVFLSGSGTFVDIPIPPTVTVTSMAILGSTLYIAGSDGTDLAGADGYLISYDISAQQTSTLARFPGVTKLKIGAVQGQLFILAYGLLGPIVTNTYLAVDCYLYSGSLQFIQRINSFITGLPPNLAYASPLSISNVATYGPYAFFAVELSPLSPGGDPQSIVCAYDVVRGVFFTATDQFTLGQHSGPLNASVLREMGIAVAAGADANQQPPTPVVGRSAQATNLPAGSYTAEYTWVGAGPTESLPSLTASFTLLSGDAFLIASAVSWPPGAIAINFYLTAAPAGVNLGFLAQTGVGGVYALVDKLRGNGALPSPPSTFGTTGDFTIFVARRDSLNSQAPPTQTMRANTFGTTIASVPVLSGGGRVISSVIDFTSATVKLYRQIVATHEPIPAGGQFSLYAFLDVDGDNLPADTVYKTTNTTVGSKVTVLLLNVLAKKLIYVVDWPSVYASVATSAHPISIAIQAATGWIFNLPLALSDSAMTNGQNAQQTCFQNQDKQLDALAARNFVRQLWRQKGGQCVVTYSDGDSYNAIIQDYHVTSKKFKTMNQPGDRKVRYEGKMMLKIAEDL